MINYSIFHNDFIFENWDNFEPEYETIEYKNGIKLKIERINEQQAQIKQIISSNPQHYLNKKIYPGKQIKTKLDI